MRINVYSQELLLDADGGLLPDQPESHTTITVAGLNQEVVGEEGKLRYSAVRQYLHSSNRLHDSFDDDDRSAITWWLPRNPERRERLAQQFEALAAAVRNAPPETGLD